MRRRVHVYPRVFEEKSKLKALRYFSGAFKPFRSKGRGMRIRGNGALRGAPAERVERNRVRSQGETSPSLLINKSIFENIS